jgi:hypothetical protein
MPNKIEIDPVFTKAYKKLAKKYPSFPRDLKGLVEDLKQNALLGVSLGGNVRKIRLAIKSKGKGKSGGARVITYALVVDKVVILMTAYDKSSIEHVTDAELKMIASRYEK